MTLQIDSLLVLQEHHVKEHCPHLYSAWSCQILFKRWTIGLYNVLFTTATPLTLELFDRRCAAEISYCYPKLYTVVMHVD
jgi:hypothetical protein